MSEIKRCPTCKRGKRKAIKEQIIKGEKCKVNLQYCYFSDEIKKALENKSNIKVVKKERKETPVKIEKKEKKEIMIIRKTS